MRRRLWIGAAVCAVALLTAAAGFLLLVRHDAGNRVGTEFSARIRPGDWLTTGDSLVQNKSSHFALRIESVRPIASPGLEVTSAHIYLYPKRLPSLSLGTVTGWPPRDPNSNDSGYQRYLRTIPSLPGTVTIPPGREAQIVVGLRSHARPGTTVRLSGFEIHYRQHWMKYRQRVGEVTTLRTVAAS